METKQVDIQEKVLLAPLTTIKTGGEARYFATAKNVSEIKRLLAWAREKNVMVHVMGGGSNTIFTDQGFDGLIIKIGLKGVRFEEKNGVAEATVAAGEDWDSFVEKAVSRNLTGIEGLSGIPGTAGAAPVQNIGAYGQSASDSITVVRVIDRQTLLESEISAEDCGFGYRTSRFKTSDKGRYIITAVVFTLKKGGKPDIRYPDLAEREVEATAAGVRKAVLEVRRGKSMAEESGLNSCGSFFMNPVMDSEEAERIKARSEKQGGNVMPVFPAGSGKVKVPAAWLIEQAGYVKGLRRGNVGISPNHALAIVNYGGTAAEVLAFADEIMIAVQAKFGIRLEKEPEVVD